MWKRIATPSQSTRGDAQRRRERRGRQHDPRGADAPGSRDRAVEQARERAQAEEGEAPERHDPAALLLGDTELEPRRRRGVRGEVAEAAHEKQH